MSGNIDPHSQRGLDSVNEAVAAWLARTGRSLDAQPGSAGGAAPGPSGPRPGPGTGIAPSVPLGDAPEPSRGVLTETLEAMKESSIAGSAQFLQSPAVQEGWVGNLLKALGAIDENLPAPEFYQQVRDEAAQASEAAAQRAGGDWSKGRIAARTGQMIGHLATPQGVASAIVTAPLAGMTTAALAARGMGAVPAIIGGEVLQSVAQGGAMRVMSGETHRDDGQLQDAATAAEQIGMDIAAGLLFGGVRGGVKIFRNTGKAGYTQWHEHLAKGVNPYTVTPITRDMPTGTLPSQGVTSITAEPTSTFAVGRGQYDPISSPSAWEPIIQGAGLSEPEVRMLRTPPASPGPTELAVLQSAQKKVNGFLATPEGKKIIDDLDRGYTQGLWVRAEEALKAAGADRGPVGTRELDPFLVAQVADAAHTGRFSHDFDIGVMRDAKGRITAESVTEWRANQGASQADAAAALDAGMRRGFMPWSRTSSSSRKGITVGDADAALDAGKTRAMRGAELDPRADEGIRTRITELDKQIDELMKTDPQAAGRLMAQRKLAVDEANAGIANRVKTEAAAAKARQQQMKADADEAKRQRAAQDAETARRMKEEQQAAKDAAAQRKKSFQDYEDKVAAIERGIARQNEIAARLKALDDEAFALESSSAMNKAESQAANRALREQLEAEHAQAVAEQERLLADAEAARQALEKDIQGAVNERAVRVFEEGNQRAQDIALHEQAGRTVFEGPRDNAPELAREPGSVAGEPVSLPLDRIAALVPDLPENVIGMLVNKATSPNPKAPVPGLHEAMREVFDSLGGADALGLPYIKWRNQVEQRINAAMNALHTEDPVAAMAEATSRLDRQAQAPATAREKSTYAEKNVTVLGRDVEWGTFRESNEADFLVSPEFTAAVARRAGLSDDALALLREAAEAAMAGAKEFQAYLAVLERHLGPEVSLTLDPASFALTRRIVAMVEDMKGVLAENNVTLHPYSDQEMFLRALSKYFAQEMHFARVDPADLATLTRTLELYVQGYHAGVLTPEAHQAMLATFGELLDNFVLHADMEHSGFFSFRDGQISLRTNTMLDTAVHEFFHAWTSTTKVGAELMEKLAGIITGKQRVQLAALTGHALDDAQYVMNTRESVVRALQAYFANGIEFTKYMPQAAEVIEAVFDAMPPEQVKLFSYMGAVQKAAATMQKQGSYKYQWMDNVQTSAIYDYARSFSLTTPKGWTAVFKAEKKAFEAGWLRDGDHIIPDSAMAYEFVKDLLEAKSLVETAEGVVGLARRRVPDHSLEGMGSAQAASAEVSLRTLAAEEAGRSFKRALELFGSAKRLLPVEPRAALMRAKDGIVSHVEPHIHQAEILAREHWMAITASENKFIRGKDGLLNQPWVKDFTRAAIGVGSAVKSGLKGDFKAAGEALTSSNTAEALRAFITGEVRLANPADNAALSKLAADSWTAGRWMTDAEIDATPGLSQSAKAAFKYITAQTIERSNALKQGFIETYLHTQADLAEFRGKGLSISDLKDTGKLSAAQVADLNLIDEAFRPGYYPTTRQGIFRIFVKNADGEIVFARGAHTIKEAEAIKARLEKDARFQDGHEVLPVSRIGEAPPLANQLDETGSTVAQVLHYLRETEHGAELTAADFQEVLRKQQEPGALRQYFAKRRDIPGWEEEDFLGRHAEFLRRSALFEHGQVFKRGIRELMLTGGDGSGPLTGQKAEDVINLYNNTMNNRSRAEEFLVDLAQSIVPNAQHLRFYSQLLRKIAYAKVLGFSTTKRIALEVSDALMVSLNLLSADAGAMSKAFGKETGFMYATIKGAEGAKDAAQWLAGFNHDSAGFKAFQKAVELGYLRVSPIEGGDLMSFLKQRRIGRPGMAALDAVLETADLLGHATIAMREMSTFAAFYRAYKELAPTMSEDALIVFAGEKTMSAQNLRPSNRPTLRGFQGEVANQVLTFKTFLGNLLGKMVQNVRLARGTWVEIPNPEWTPGSSVEKYIKLEHRDISNIMKFLGVATGIGGTLGIPIFGWFVNEWNYWTGRDETLTWKKEIEAALPGEPGRFLGAFVDKGLSAEYLGWDMSDLGNLFLPQSRDGFLSVVAPAAISIIGQSIHGAYSAVTEEKPMQEPTYRFLKAVAPNAVKPLIDAGQLAANRGRFYNAQGELIGKVTVPDIARLALAGVAPLRDEEFRARRVDDNLRTKHNKRLGNLASRIARKITNGQTLEPDELGAIWTNPGVWPRVRARLRDATIPSYAQVWKSIRKDKDPESASFRWQVYQLLWQDALNRADDAEED